jgi:uncharacterized paraquat-inducible protein A
MSGSSRLTPAERELVGTRTLDRTELDVGQGVADPTPNTVVVCTDCEEYHDGDTDDWEVCPKCGTELLEVSEA